MTKRLLRDFSHLSTAELIRKSCEVFPEIDAEELLAEVIARHGPRVRRRVYALIGPPKEDVEDAEQEIWVRVWRGRCLFAGETEMEARGWIDTITENYCKTALRRTIPKEQLKYDGDPENDFVQDHAVSGPAADTPSDYDVAMSMLSEDDPKAAMLLHAKYVEKWTWDEIMRDFDFETRYEARKAVAAARRALVRFLTVDG